jgi:serine/threonine-protein kinase HipA
MTSERQAYIYVQLPGTLTMVPAALLKIATQPDTLPVGTFRYGDRYLKRKDAIPLDPLHLPLDAQPRQFTKLGGLPGAVRDASPDAWGRRVIERQLQRAPADLDEIDYLLQGPQEGAGWLSFGDTPKPPVSARLSAQTHQLPDLLAAVRAVEENMPLPALALLDHLHPGTSMGGARPKATLEDQNTLWLAKFPSKDDRFNFPRVELATLELARRCGINAARGRLITVGQSDVLLLERFDRERTEGGYLRHGLVSALTVLDADEDYLDRSSWSYPLFADHMRQWSAAPSADSKELFRRMVFNAAITNNDDHPRNHALIFKDGWRLSPAYDIVPTPTVSQERELALVIGKYGRAASIYNLVSMAKHFGLAHDDAKAVLDEVVAGVQTWREVFAACGVSRIDIDYVASAILPECFFRPAAPE